jgi:hypothetical protein
LPVFSVTKGYRFAGIFGPRSPRCRDRFFAFSVALTVSQHKLIVVKPRTPCSNNSLKKLKEVRRFFQNRRAGKEQK